MASWIAIELAGMGDSVAGEVPRLVRLARGGDIAAFEQLVRLHERQVLRVAQRLLGHREDARDAAQEAFLRVFRFLSSYDERREFGGWLHRIVVNACHDLRRRLRHRAFQRPIEELPAAVEAQPGDQESLAERGQARRLLERALLALTDREREAVVLRDVEGLGTDEVARALGCSEGTVRSHLARGRLKLHAEAKRLAGGGS